MVALLSSTGHAVVTVQVNSASSAVDGNALFDSDLNALASTVTVGGFLGGLPNFSGDPSAILSAFTSNGSPQAFAGGFANVTIDDAATSTDSSDNFTSPDPNATLYAIIGDPLSDEILVFEGPLWPNELEGLGGTAAISLRESNLVRGIAPDGLEASGFQGITFVPEPSVAILGALGFLGLLRRRR